MKASEPGRQVLQICHSYSPPFQDCARQYAALFKDSGYRVTTVFLTGVDNPAITAEVDSDEVVYLNYRSSALKGLKLKLIADIKRITQQQSYQFCIAHRTKPTYVALMATSLPVLSVHHAFGDFARLGRRLLANAFKSRLTLIGVSNAVCKDIRSALPAWPEHKIQTLYNRIDLHVVQQGLLSKKAAREQLGFPADARIIANVGRLHPDKDQATLIRAFAKALPQLAAETLLVIIGKGKLEHELKALSQQLKVSERVIFTGQVAHAKQFFKAFDLFVLSSDHEPFGMVLLEAMAAGVPVICSDVGGGAEVVAEVGQTFRLGDSTALSQLLIASESASAPTPEQAFRVIENKFSDTAAKQRFFDVILPLVTKL